MKILSRFMIILFLVSGCKSKISNELSNQDIEIHLQGWFSDTPVEVYLDNSSVFLDTVSTGSIIAVAMIIPMNISEGKHKLRVKVGDSVESEEVFEIESTLFIGVNYDSTERKILFSLQKEPFIYF